MRQTEQIHGTLLHTCNYPVLPKAKGVHGDTSGGPRIHLHPEELFISSSAPDLGQRPNEHCLDYTLVRSTCPNLAAQPIALRADKVPFGCVSAASSDLTFYTMVLVQLAPAAACQRALIQRDLSINQTRQTTDRCLT
eukprot:4183561-Pyramimonas_sp.AAC.1